MDNNSDRKSMSELKEEMYLKQSQNFSKKAVTKAAEFGKRELVKELKKNASKKTAQNIAKESAKKTAKEVAKKTSKETTKAMVSATVSAGTTASGAVAGSVAPGIGNVAGAIAGKKIGDKAGEGVDNTFGAVNSGRNVLSQAKQRFIKEKEIEDIINEDASPTKTFKNIFKTYKHIKKIELNFNMLIPGLGSIGIILIGLLLFLMILLMIFGHQPKRDSNVKSGEILDDMVYYNQGDPEWKDYPYPRPDGTPKTIAGTGCGPTAMAMCVATFVDTSVIPPTIADFNLKIGARADGGTSTAIMVPRVCAEYDMHYEEIGGDYENKIRSALDDGKLIIWSANSGRNCHFTKGGHIMILRAYSDNLYYVADPNDSEAKDHNHTGYTWDFIRDCMSFDHPIFAVWSDQGRLCNTNYEDTAQVRSNIVTIAQQYIGTPYVENGIDLMNGISSTNFVYGVLAKVGHYLNSSSAQFMYEDKQLVKKKIEDVQPGDLVFYGKNEKSIIHVGIYLGENKIIHSLEGKGVCLSYLNFAKGYNCYVASVFKNDNYSNTDLTYMASVMESEAGGGSYEAKCAVGYCVMNRVEDPRFGNTVKDVVTAKSQFTSPWNKYLDGSYSAATKKAAQDVLSKSAPNPIGKKKYFISADYARSKGIYEKGTPVDPSNRWHNVFYDNCIW